jgi:hypothetical protein
VSGEPVEILLRNLTFTLDPDVGVLTDSGGVAWYREGAEPTPAPATSGTMWPQTSLEEVRAAQELADADDPAYTWQVDGGLTSEEWWDYIRGSGTEIVDRFIREVMGWEQFVFNPYEPSVYPTEEGVLRVVYLRCSPGGTNTWYPTAPSSGHNEAPGIERCAPTIGDDRFESVSIDIAQPGDRGRSGIWVVTRWSTTAPFAQVDPGVAEARATGLLEEFLAARVAGQGAEGIVACCGAYQAPEFPLLYATTGGAPYERYEFEQLTEPLWPYADMEFTVRMFANGDETVVEQPISWSGSVLTHRAERTTENGEPVAARYVFLDGLLSLSAAEPWGMTLERWGLDLNDEFGEAILVVADPGTVESGCEFGPAPVDVEAMALSLQSDLDLDLTDPVPVTIGGADGLQMDVVSAPGASDCEGMFLVVGDDSGSWRSPHLEPGSRMRLYLLDVPEGLTARVLAIAVVAPEVRFERVLEMARPVLDSVEIPAP